MAATVRNTIVRACRAVLSVPDLRPFVAAGHLVPAGRPGHHGRHRPSVSWWRRSGPEQSRFLGKVALLIFVSVGGYVLMSFACMKLFRKADKPGWLGFVPILNLVLLLELAGKPVWWLGLYFVFHLLSSLAGLALPNVFFFLFVLLVLSSPLIALQIIVGTGLARNFGKTQEFGIGLGLLPIVFLPMLAFSDAAYVAGGKCITAKVAEVVWGFVGRAS